MLVKCQKRALRIICGVCKYEHTAPLFERLKILNLRSIYIQAVLIFLYKYQNKKLPKPFKDFFITNGEVHGHFTRQSDLFHPPMAKCHQRLSSMKAAGVKIFNAFITKLDYKQSYATFKYNLKQSLFALSDTDKKSIC